MRTYDIAMGKTPEYMAAVRDVALPVRESYGVKLAGWYYTDIGALNRVVHIWAYRDYAHFEEAREAFRTDERWLNDYVPRVKGIILRQEKPDDARLRLLRVDADGNRTRRTAIRRNRTAATPRQALVDSDEAGASPTDAEATDTDSMDPDEGRPDTP